MSEEQKNILIIEDEKPLAHALELKLSRAGFAVEVTSDGERGVAALERGGFDLVLLDLVMPKKDGFAVLENMKERGDKTPAIVLSNLSQKEDEQKVRELGAQDFFIKSNMPIADVVNRVQTLLQ